MARNRELEEELLLLCSGRQVYRQEVSARLDAFEANGGGNLQGWEADVDKILAEAQEEAADVTGWLLGVAGRLDRERMGRLVAAMRLAALAHEQIEELRIELALG